MTTNNQQSVPSTKQYPVKSILRNEDDHPVCLGAYNLQVKRASFKDDVLLKQVVQTTPTLSSEAEVVIEKHLPIAPDDTEVELPAAELQKREEFKAKRRVLALEGADGKNLKAILAHGSSINETFEDEGEGLNSTNDVVSSKIVHVSIDPVKPVSLD